MRNLQKKHLKYYRKLNRWNATPEEKLLWKYLRRKRLDGFRFQRQYSVDNYILDFYCPKAKLGIELDGGHHNLEEVEVYDRIRTIHIESYGIKILRFWNNEVNNRMDDVLRTIHYNLSTSVGD